MMSFSNIQNMEFRTERLVCRLLQPSDRENYCSMYTHDWVMSKISDPLTHDAAGSSFTQELELQQKRPYERLLWSMYDLDGGFCGLQGLIWHSPGDTEAEIGFMLNQHSASKGLSSEGMGALVDVGFSSLNLNRIIGRYNPENIPVTKFVTKLGFTHLDGVFEEEGLRYRSIYLDKEDWQPLNTAFS